MVAILVGKYHQPLDQAWRFTFREFLRVANLEGELKKLSGGTYDRQRVEGLINHLRNRGVSV